MIKLENTEVMGWEHAMRGMRNPMNSWTKADSYTHVSDLFVDEFVMGPNDHDLAMRLAKGGSVHAKYRRMIAVYVDITAPLYWWKEFDTYKVGTVANSCSTMHKIADHEFTLDDFSTDHLTEGSLKVLQSTIDRLNFCREVYLKDKDKDVWWQMIQLLPTSYNQRRTLDLNYETCRTIIHQRSGHKLDEWNKLVEILKDLPYMGDLWQ